MVERETGHARGPRGSGCGLSRHGTPKGSGSMWCASPDWQRIPSDWVKRRHSLWWLHGFHPGNPHPPPVALSESSLPFHCLYVPGEIYRPVPFGSAAIHFFPGADPSCRLAERLIRSAGFLPPSPRETGGSCCRHSDWIQGASRSLSTGWNSTRCSACPDADVARLREKMNAANKPIVAVVARLARQSIYDTLINAAPAILEAHPGTVFAIAGDGPLREKLERKAAELGVEASFRFLGHFKEMALSSCCGRFCAPHSL